MEGGFVTDENGKMGDGRIEEEDGLPFRQGMAATLGVTRTQTTKRVTSRAFSDSESNCQSPGRIFQATKINTNHNKMPSERNWMAGETGHLLGRGNRCVERH